MKNAERDEGADMMACDVGGGLTFHQNQRAGLTFPGFSSAKHIYKKKTLK